VGEAIGEGDDVTAPEFELFAGSHAATNSVNRTVESNNAGLIALGFELLIREIFIKVYLVRTRLKSGRILLERGVYQQWVFPQVFHRNCPLCWIETLNLKTVLARFTNAEERGKPTFLTQSGFELNLTM
jgi:hypothetical protein